MRDPEEKRTVLDPQSTIHIARQRQAERIELAREHRLALITRQDAPGVWGRAVLRLADLLLTTGEGLRARYRPSALPGGESGGWA